MQLLMLFLVIGTAVQAKSRISQSSFQAANFAEPIQGRKLNGRVIKEPIVDSETSCQFECMADERCQSYNFGKNSSGQGFKCELSNSDRFASPEGFTYGGLQSACEAESSLCGNKEICIPNYPSGSARCKCSDGYTGKPCIQESCVQLRQDGFTSSGVYTINPDGGEPMHVLCDMSTDGGGWTVFQRRLDGSVDFYHDWELYKKGFGNLNGEFWLGNDNLHRLTAAYNVTMRVDLEDFEGNARYAKYSTFKVADESDKYRISIGGYSGTAGNSMTSDEVYWKVDGMRFTTKDRDNDLSPSGNCAGWYKGAWWYNSCHASNLNGLYLKGNHPNKGIGVNWGLFRGYYYSLKHTEMKVKSKL